jgi:putative endonuclease
MRRWIKSLFKTEPAGPSARTVLGEGGENAAARYLRGLGYRIIERNFRCEVGEVDIIARQGKTLVFVEVKTREEDDPAPEDQVSLEKQHRCTKAARSYLSRYGSPQPPARFDVVGIVWPPGQAPQIRHTIDAFEATF